MNPKILVLLGLIFSIITILTVSYTIYLVRTEGGQCMADPFVYGAKKIANQTQSQIYCSCSLTKADGSRGQLQFTPFGRIPNQVEQHP